MSCGATIVGMGVVQAGRPTPGVIVCVGVMAEIGGGRVRVEAGVAEPVGDRVGMGLSVTVGVSVGSSAGGGVAVIDAVRDGAGAWVWTTGRAVETGAIVGNVVGDGFCVGVACSVGDGLCDGLGVGVALVGEMAASGAGTGLATQALRLLATSTRCRTWAMILTRVLHLVHRPRKGSPGCLDTLHCCHAVSSGCLLGDGDLYVFADPIVHLVPGHNPVAKLAGPVGAVL
jgi:hypothetical protein